MIDVVAAGHGTSVQDLGRTGFAAWGIGAGGAADRASLRLANRLVGNPDGVAALEVLLGGLILRTDSGVLVAVTGAPVRVTIDGRAGSVDAPLWVPPGSTLALGTPATQLRSYVAVRGGIDTEVLVGSRSVDEASGVGRALQAGDSLRVGTDTTSAPVVDYAPRATRSSESLILQGVLGPRDDWFDEGALTNFIGQTWTVQAASNRVGVRLAGDPLVRSVPRELLSEPTIRGAVEVPADGQPIVFGADHPTTCGYPVIAVLDAGSADDLSQCRPGETVSFRLRRPAVRLAFPALEGRTT